MVARLIAIRLEDDALLYESDAKKGLGYLEVDEDRLPEQPIVSLVARGTWREPDDRTEKAAEALPDIDDAPLDLAHTAEQAMVEYMPKFIKAFAATTYDSVKEAVIRAQRDGSGAEGVTRTIGHLFSKTRARAVAVTETTRLYGLGAQATYKEVGLKEWEWMTVKDSWVCPTCRPRHTKRFPLTEDFDPGHPRCRCFPRPVAMRAEDLEPEAPSLEAQQEAAGWYQARPEDTQRLFGTQESYKSINAALRAGGALTDEQRKWTERFDATIAVHKTTQDRILYRGMPMRELESLKPGGIISDAGFVSTSSELRIARRFGKEYNDEGDTQYGLIHIKTPKGTAAVDLDPLLKQGVVGDEVVLARNLRYRVVSNTLTKEDDVIKRVVELEVVP